MYRIYSGEQILHHPYADFSENKTAISAKLAEEVNTHGSLDMVLDDPPNIWLRSPIEVYDDDGMAWRGRILSLENGFVDGRKNYHCEGWLAVLCDTIIQPFSFRGRPGDYTSGGQTVKGLFHHFIDQHNAQLPANDPRRFTVGIVNVTDPNNFIYRSSESAMTTWEAIKTRLLDINGGYVYLSGDDLNVINYVADFDDTSYPTVHFGENLIDLVNGVSADGLVTMLYAYGAQNDEEHTEPEPGGPDTLQYLTWNGNRVHLDSPVGYPSAVSKWGVIYGTATFDDITIAENLVDAAGYWLSQNLRDHAESLEITAADLSLLDPTIEKMGVGRYVSIVCEPLHIDDLLMLCIRKVTDLLDVSQTTVTIGRPQNTLTGMVGG